MPSGRNQYPTGSDLLAFLEAAGFSTSVTTDVAPLGGDLELFAAAGWQEFNLRANRSMLAVAGSRSFDRAACNGVLVLGDDLASGTAPTVSDNGTALTVGEQVRFEPMDAAARGVPYNRARFAWSRYRYLGGLPYSVAPPVTITGAWGYALTIPEAAWVGMLALGAMKLLPMLAQARTQGFESWDEADMTERYGANPLGTLETRWLSLALASCGGRDAQGRMVYGIYTRIPMG